MFFGCGEAFYGTTGYTGGGARVARGGASIPVLAGLTSKDFQGLVGRVPDPILFHSKADIKVLLFRIQAGFPGRAGLTARR